MRETKTEKKSFFKKDIFRIALVLIGVRVLMLILGFIFFKMRMPEGSLGTFENWLAQAGDIPHFLHIAEHGYSVGDEFENLVVFYPLFPLLIRMFSFVFRDYYLSGFIISNICAVVAGCYLYKLATLDHEKQVARNSVLFMMLYPFCFFMGFAYTESLFLMLSIMCVYYARRGNWILCGLLGGLSAICRTQGIIIFGVAAYEYVVQAADRVHEGDFTAAEKIKGFFKNLKPTGLALLLIPAGYGGYLALNKYLFGDWFKFMEFQAAAPWYNGMDWFTNNLQQHMNMAMQYPGMAFIIYLPQVVLFLVAMLLVFAGIKNKVRTSYLLHIAAYTIISFSSSWLISGPRYMLGCFFMFPVLATLARNRYMKIFITVISSGLLFMMFYLYIMQHPIM